MCTKVVLVIFHSVLVNLPHKGRQYVGGGDYSYQFSALKNRKGSNLVPKEHLGGLFQRCFGPDRHNRPSHGLLDRYIHQMAKEGPRIAITDNSDEATVAEHGKRPEPANMHFLLRLGE